MSLLTPDLQALSRFATSLTLRREAELSTQAVATKENREESAAVKNEIASPGRGVESLWEKAVPDSKGADVLASTIA